MKPLLLFLMFAIPMSAQSATGIQVSLQWTADTGASSTNPGTYAVLRAPAGTVASPGNCTNVAQGNYTTIAPSVVYSATAVSQYTDTGVTAGNIYCYEITYSSPAFSGVSPPSAPTQVSAVVPSQAPQPGAPTATVTQTTVATTVTIKTLQVAAK